MAQNDSARLSSPEASHRVPLIYSNDNQIVIDRRLAYGLAGFLALTSLAIVILALKPGLAGSLLAMGEADPNQSNVQTLLTEVNPPQGYTLNTRYGDIGPQLLAAGAIDQQAFIKLYSDSGSPLTDDEIAILMQSSDQQITINQQNARFLLNLFWAFGLTNQNPILDEGPLMENGESEIGRFASTGGWTLGTKSATDLYSSAKLVQLTPDQQALVEEAAANTYRPCCNNSTAFADCNHGMAMLGLYELMASQGATLDEMYRAAKHFNAFWFPQQALQLAVYFRATTDQRFAEVDPRTIVSAKYSSASGAQVVQGWLAEKNLLPQDVGGGSCGV